MTLKELTYKVGKPQIRSNVKSIFYFQSVNLVAKNLNLTGSDNVVATMFILDLVNAVFNGNNTFYYNEGEHGGGLAMNGSNLTITKGSILTFNNNNAFYYGGAMYINTTHFNTALICNGSINFTNNHARLAGQSIYTTDTNINIDLFEKCFEAPLENIATAPVEFNATIILNHHPFFPGQFIFLNISLVDGLGNPGTCIAEVSLKCKNAKTGEFVFCERLYPNIGLQLFGPNYVYLYGKSKMCIQIHEILCPFDSMVACIKNGYWTNANITIKCPYPLCDSTHLQNTPETQICQQYYGQKVIVLPQSPDDQCSTNRGVFQFMIALFILAAVRIKLEIGAGFIYGPLIFLAILGQMPFGYYSQYHVLKVIVSSITSVYLVNLEIFVWIILLLLVGMGRCCPRLLDKIQDSPMQAICLLMMLSFWSMTSTSIHMLRPLKIGTSWYTAQDPYAKYFEGDHIIVGLAAIAIITLAILPFISVLAMSNFELPSRIFRLHRFKPLFDEFQSCYLDKHLWIILLLLVGMGRCCPHLDKIQDSPMQAICLLMMLSFWSMTDSSIHMLEPLIIGDSWYTAEDPYAKYFGRDHIIVGLAAIAIISLAILPFISVLAMSNFELSSRIFRLHRFKPIFDEFQSCYVDKHRWYCVVYYISFILYLILVFAGNPLGPQLLLVLLLSLHFVVQPYKKHILNVIDMLLLLDLLVLYSLLEREEELENRKTIYTSVLVHMMTLIPLLYMVVGSIGIFCLQCKHRLKIKSSRFGIQWRTSQSQPSKSIRRTELIMDDDKGEREPLIGIIQDDEED
uniref:Uncharacterized protein n=1 Tax=Amphimedon queenslandica TaxID=400682 RepID=A0A1X7UYM3_AMPQE